MNQVETEERKRSVWNQVEGNWNQAKGVIKEKWNALTDDDIEMMEGRRDRVVGKIQERYGEAQWKRADIERELDKSLNR
ncbi:MAG: CsbD family protein [Thermoanaerobaculia bacterium]|nr:CsbD family protein [Thermoanaerobaculia bacterium]